MQSVEFPLSLIFGIVVIGIFAYRQLDQPVHVSHHSPVRRLRSRIPSEIGSKNFVEAYVYYLVLLLIGYFLLCFSETFYAFVTKSKQSGAQTQEFDLSSPTWPLYVALIIVGLSPNFPILKDVERFFRRFAQRSAGIPRNFESYFEKIRGFSFSGMPSHDPYIQEDLLQQTRELSLVLKHSKIKHKEAPRIERRILRFFILYYWSISPHTPILWRNQVPLQLEKSGLEEIADRASEILNTLHREAKDAAWMPAVLNAAAESAELTADGTAGEPHTHAALGDHADAIDEFANRVREAVNEHIKPHVADIEAAFCFLFSNDPRPQAVTLGGSDSSRDNFYDDPVFSRVREHLLSFNTQTTRNIIAITICVMTAAVFVLLPLLQPIINGTPLDKGLSQAGLLKATRYAFGTAVLFGSALIAGTAFRYVRMDAGKFMSFKDSDTFPFVQYTSVFVAAFLITAISQNFVWMVHAFDAMKSFQQNIFEYYQQVWWRVTAFSLVGALFSSVFVAWLQRVSEGAEGRAKILFLKRLAQSFLFALIIAILTLVIFAITAPGESTAVLTRNGAGSRLTEIVVAFLATLSGLAVAARLFYSLERKQEEAS